jgi:predicted transcriptional regulator
VAETVQEVMTPSPVTVADEAPLSEAGRLMAQHDIGALIVEHEGQIAGILTTATSSSGGSRRGATSVGRRWRRSQAAS